MKQSLYHKLLLGYLIFGILSFITIATFSAGMTQNFIMNNESHKMYREATAIADRISSNYGSDDLNTDTYQDVLTALSSYDQSDIWLVDPKGDVIVDSSNKYTGSAISGFNPTRKGKKLYVTGNYYDMYNYDVLSVLSPITGNMQTYGYVIIHLPLSTIDSQTNYLLNVVYLTSVIIFVLSLILIVVFSKVVYIPIRKITFAAGEYAKGNFSVDIPVKSKDEIGILARTLNFMSDELEKSEEYQHKFIANISHDFRSPLTSIKGYLEAIQDGTIPPELQDKYIGIVISETDRLNKLTQGLLTLNTLDSGKLVRSNFDINRTIKNTALSFEGSCMKRGITFDLTFSNPSQFVYADLGKIEQVLYNLIDNAIKFSRDKSVIYIQTSTRNEKVYVSVKDTGVGIPRDSVNKIWERFYKTDSSRGRDKKGTGLGLSIVKEIITAHGENIDVVSTEGIGTEFIFSLPKMVNME